MIQTPTSYLAQCRCYGRFLGRGVTEDDLGQVDPGRIAAVLKKMFALDPPTHEAVEAVVADLSPAEWLVAGDALKGLS